jgi:DNA-binding MarR family transcriptional regulator
MAAYDAFYQRMVAVHSPEVVDLGLTLAQLKAIYVVAAGGPLSMGALSERLGTALSTTSGTVDRLVRRGYLERHEDPADRRQVLVTATASALDQIEQMSELGRERMRRLLTSLPTTDDIATIERAMELLGDALATLHEEPR